MSKKRKYKVGDKVSVIIDGIEYNGKIFARDRALGIGDVYLIQVELSEDKDVFVCRFGSELNPS